MVYFFTTEPISRVLLKTVIYLVYVLPHKSCHLHETCRAGTKCFATVLLRIGFTSPRSLLSGGELLPRLSTLTDKSRRYISVALSLGSPPAAVSRYSRPVELGLSSDKILWDLIRNCSVHS